MVYLFDIPAYVIVLRETVECTIILVVLLSFIDQFISDNEIVLRKHLKKQIWIGTFAGLLVIVLVGAVFIAVFYTAAENLFENSESAWEGSFSLIASFVISLMALSLIRVQQWKTKWEKKLQSATETYLERHEKGNKWALILLPFTVICREGLESIIFIAGIGYDNEPTGLPIPVITGIISGLFIGWLLYKGSHLISLTIFFAATTTLLLFISAGLFSLSVYALVDATKGNHTVLWDLKCCDPEDNGFWDVMKSIFGWRPVATVDSTVSYFVYWFVLIVAVVIIKLRGRKTDMKALEEKHDINDNNDNNETVSEKNEAQLSTV